MIIIGNILEIRVAVKESFYWENHIAFLKEDIQSDRNHLTKKILAIIKNTVQIHLIRQCIKRKCKILVCNRVIWECGSLTSLKFVAVNV